MKNRPCPLCGEENRMINPVVYLAIMCGEYRAIQEAGPGAKVYLSGQLLQDLARLHNLIEEIIDLSGDAKAFQYHKEKEKGVRSNE